MEKSSIKKAIFDVLRGIVLSLVINVVLVLVIALVVIALVVKFTGIDQTVATILNQAAKVLSLALGIAIGFRSGRYGWLLGAIVGTVYTVLGFATFSLLSGKSLFTDLTVFDFLIGIAAGVFSGILAVNLHTLSRSPQRTRHRHPKTA